MEPYSVEVKAGAAAVECCSITSFFGEDDQVSIPLFVFFYFFGRRTRWKVGHQWLV
jgi:hypothetical protein